MRAITICNDTNPASLQLVERPSPTPATHDILIEVAYAALNRADVLQRQGGYPAPENAPADIPGLEVSGTIAAIGDAVTRWQVGDEVCALLSGGGYSEYVLADESLCLPIPKGLTTKEAATLPECITTVWDTVFEQAALQPGESLLVHGGSSGIGTTAIQMAKAHGSPIFVTAGSDAKCTACDKLGATTINYRKQDFVDIIREAGGVDVILDIVGGDYINRNFKCLRPRGRMVSIACLHGTRIDINMGGLLMKSLQWSGSTLRARSVSEKAALIANIRQHIWPQIASGQIKPVIDSIFTLEEAAKAQEKMEKSLHIGKIILQVGG